MILFCAAVELLFATTLCALYVLFSNVLNSQFICRLQKAAIPVATVLASDPSGGSLNVKHIDVLDEYFEVLDVSGRVLQKSKNLQNSTLNINGDMDPSRETFKTFEDERLGRQRVTVIPFHQGARQQYLAVSMSERYTDAELITFRHIIMWLLPLSLLAIASISRWYVGRSLRPVKDLTSRVAQLTDVVGRASVSNDESINTINMQLVASNPRDELHRLAVTFNQLFHRIHVVMQQLRQFVADASHELRTPLAILQGETELLLARRQTIDVYENTVRVMDGELKRLSRIVESLFTLSMADSGQLRLMREPLYLNEVIEQACVRIEAIADSKQISIRRDLASDLVHFGDETFLQELAIIFLDNAIKYSPSGSEVRVQLERGGDNIRLAIQDQGRGIASKDCPHIFERFFRGQNVRSSESRSGGLGLAIAKAIVEAEGGSIDCNSILGSGTTFVVTLPYTAIPPEHIEDLGTAVQYDVDATAASVLG